MKNDRRIPSAAVVRLARIGCAFATTLLVGIGTASAAPGDTLDSFDAVLSGVPLCPLVPEVVPPSSIGTGLAYDGTNLILSCWRSNKLERVSPAAGHAYGGSVTIAGVTAGGLGAISWDTSRNKLWACDLGTGPQPVERVVLIDMATQQVVANPAPFVVPSCASGLAYDPDGTLWVSNPFTESVYHYTTGGVLIPPSPFFTGDPADLFSGYPNFGVEEACGQLYVSSYDGNEIYQTPKDLSGSTLFHHNGSALLSDMTRDTTTFKVSDGVDAMWVLDSYDVTGERLVYASELPVCPNNPPVCTGAKVLGNMWPPNHKFVKISVTGVTDADGDTIVITPTGIRQDEVVKGNGAGAGNTDPDGQLSPLAVRSERNGTPKSPGNGRVYHVAFTASDGKGGTCDGVAKVCVPHDQYKNTCIDGGPLYDSLVP